MKIFDERGITLVELLLTLTVSAIILPIIYGVFASGYQLYNKIQIEGQLRDDADYTVSMIMNEMHSFPFDYVKKCEGTDNCIELIDETYTEIKAVEGKSFYSINQSEIKSKEEQRSIKIQLGKKIVDGKEIVVFMIGGNPINVASNFDGSTLTFDCSSYVDDSKSICEKAIINLNFHVDHNRLNKPLELQSSFGF